MVSGFDDDILAVVAHSLLNSLAVIHGDAETLAVSWDRMEAQARVELLRRIVTQAEHVGSVLTDLVRSGRPEVLEALEEMQAAARGER